MLCGMAFVRRRAEIAAELDRLVHSALCSTNSNPPLALESRSARIGAILPAPGRQTIMRGRPLSPLLPATKSRYVAPCRHPSMNTPISAAAIEGSNAMRTAPSSPRRTATQPSLAAAVWVTTKPISRFRFLAALAHEVGSQQKFARRRGAKFHRAGRENGDQLAACRSEHNVPFLRVIE